MMKRSRWTIPVLVAALCLLAGCGRSGVPAQPDPAPAVESGEAVPDSAPAGQPEPPAQPPAPAESGGEDPTPPEGELSPDPSPAPDSAPAPDRPEQPPQPEQEAPAEQQPQPEQPPDGASPAPQPAPAAPEPAGPDSASPAPLADGAYTASVTLEGGTGRASVASPAALRVEGGAVWATIVWSSPNFDYMKVDGEKYELTGTGGNSTFEIPVSAFDRKLDVIADTVAMSEPHEVEYTLYFDSATLQKQ